MAVLFTDGFDQYSAVGDVLRRWLWESAAVTSLVAGRFGGLAVRFGATGRSLVTKLPSVVSTVGAGMAYRSSTFAATCSVMSFRDTPQTIQVGMSIDTGGHIAVWRGTTANNLGTGTTVLSVNTFYFIEWLVTISGTVGTIQVYIDGVLELNLSSLNTKSTANATVDAFGLDSGTGNTDYDDLYIFDTSGSVPQSTFLGPCQIQYLAPDADTAQKNFTPDTGVTNFSRVNETVADTTNYVSSNATGKDLYTVSDLAVTPFIFAVKTTVLAQRMDAGVRTVRGITKNSATTSNGATANINADPIYLDDIYNQNPATSAQWTAADVNAMQVGAEIIT